MAAARGEMMEGWGGRWRGDLGILPLVAGKRRGVFEMVFGHVWFE
jgi:hypothetical protein